MNRLQIARQVQTLLRAVAWSDAEVAFASASVPITLGITEDVAPELRLPLAMIRPGDEDPDPGNDEEPGSVGINFSVVLVVANAQDRYGETALVGSQRTTGSTGRGLLEVEELVKTALLQKGPASGLPIVFRGSTTSEPITHSSLGYIVIGTYRFRAVGTVARTYQRPAGFAATASAGSVALSWNTATRWDHRRFILRRASGSTAPTTSSSGTGVTLGGTPDGASATSVSDTLAAGTYSYSLFAAYDDTDSSTDAQVSAARSITGLVVT